MSEHLEPVRLSAAGEARRAAMGRDLRGLVERRGRRRKAAEVLCLGLVLGLGAVLLGVGARAPVAPAPPVQVPRRAGPEVQYVATDAGAATRWTVTTEVDPAVYVDDLEFLRLLREAGRPTGMVRSEGRAWTSRDVVNAME